MLIKNLSLINFRNFSEYKVEFGEKLNCIVDNNGVGKTNILEAIHLLANFRSFKKQGDEVLLKNNEEGFNVKLSFMSDKEHEIEYQYDKSGTKKIFFDKELAKKISSIYGQLLVTTFTPNDVYLFIKTPEDRRKVLDEVLSLVDKTYLYSFTRYKKILKERNQLFAREIDDEDIINLYSDELIAPGYKLLSKRREFVININRKINFYYEKLTGSNTNTLKLIYVNPQKRIDSYEVYLATMRKLFSENRSEERIKKHTIFGPHRDDLQLLYNNTPIEEIASQSQTKLALLAFKLATVDYIFKMTNLKPILLLDDIVSDLDEIRINNLIALISDLDQVIITTSNKNLPFLNKTNLIQID